MTTLSLIYYAEKKHLSPDNTVLLPVSASSIDEEVVITLKMLFILASVCDIAPHGVCLMSFNSVVNGPYTGTRKHSTY